MEGELASDELPLTFSEDLVKSPCHKEPGVTEIDFDGFLDPSLKLYENVAQGCGGQLWPAGMVLAKYLLRETQLRQLRDKRIIELGAGGGLVGLAIALALSKSDHLNDAMTSIHMTDQEQMLPIMHRNLVLNKLSGPLISAGILDWGTPINSTITMKQPDILLAAECVYFEPAFPLLMQTMAELIGKDTVCFFCFKKRRRADLRFVKDAKKLFKIEEVLDDPEREHWSKENLFMYKITKKP